MGRAETGAWAAVDHVGGSMADPDPSNEGVPQVGET